MDKKKRPPSRSNGDASPSAKTNGHLPSTAVASAEALVRSLRVIFADGLHADLSFRKLGVDPRIVDLTTLKILPATEGIAFLDRESEPFVIDGPTLRYHADSEYARQIDERIKLLKPSAARLDRLIEKNGPPKEWFDTPQSKLF